MSKNTKIILGVIVIIAAFLFVAFGGDENAKKSSGGGGEISLELIASPSSLPENVTLEDVQAIQGDDIVTESGDILTTFNLLPEGAQFSEPVVFEFSIPMEDPTLFPIIIHSSEEGDEIINDTEVSYDSETGIAKVRGTVMHFSKLIMVSDWGFATESTGGGEYLVNGSVPYTFTIKPNGDRFDYTDTDSRRYLQSYVEGSTYSIGEIKVGTQLDKAGVLTPKVVVAPERVDLKQTDEYSYSDTFWCQQEGEEKVYAGPISIHFKVFGFRRDEDGYIKKQTSSVKAWAGIHTKYTCKEKEKGGMVRLPPPYVIICADGSGSISGNPLYDKNTIEPILDSEGNYIDSLTGQSAVCPGAKVGSTPPEAQSQIENN